MKVGKVQTIKNKTEEGAPARDTYVAAADRVTEKMSNRALSTGPRWCHMLAVTRHQYCAK